MTRQSDDARRRLELFAAEILGFAQPMGRTMQNGCWGARAIATAEAAGEDVLLYFGITKHQLDGAIKLNAVLPDDQRNVEMARHTLSLVFR